ncbi:MAG: hypothetical protein E7145_05035 [Rikenellaceae bacterium]|nr:hypothetical protein [Rikenellaceae bacterium]
MELKTLQKELQRLSELASGWQTADDITTIERDLMLARLRDLYEALRFGVEQAETVAVPVMAPVEAEREEPVEEAPIEEEPMALEADDFFSLEGILPVEEFAEEPMAEEVPFVEEEAAPEVEEQPEPVAEEPAPEVEEQSEPVAEEPAPAVEAVAPVVEEPAPAVEEVAPKAEEPAVNPFATLFGAEPAADPHRRKQRVIMSLYDAPEVAPKPEPKPEPKVEPIVEEEQIEEVAEETEELYVTPVEEAAESDEEVIEISEEELERLPEPQPKPLETKAAERSAEEDVEVLEEPAQEQPKSEPESAVLGEVIQPKTTLADQLATKQTVNDLRPRVTDLRRAVGLNDKFLLIRDLFGGNGSLYEITIRKLNEFDNFDDCMIYIAEHFAWDPNSDGAKLMLDLLERKFDQQ